MFHNRFARSTVLLAVGTVLGLGLSQLRVNSRVQSTARVAGGVEAGVFSPGGRGDSGAGIAQGLARDPAERDSQPDWCAEHLVPESECTLCKPSLIESFKAKGDWCSEHGLPESHCRTCHPDLVFATAPAPLQPQDFSLKLSVFFPPNRTGCATDGAIIQFASAETAERAGLTVEPALAAHVSDAIEAPAELVFDETRTMALTSTIPLAVIRWLVNPGQAVTPDQALAEVESPEMAQMRAEYSEVRAEWIALDAERARQEKLHQANLISAGDYQLAVAAAGAAEARVSRERGLLLAAGLPSDAIDALAEHAAISDRFMLRAPTGGTLIERREPLGELLTAGTSLATISDPQALWIEARVREQELRQVRIGSKMEFAADGDALERIGGEVIWVAQYLDHDTRTGLVRARLLDQAHQLRAHEFGRARINTGDAVLSVVVPMDAVQWEGCCNVVFVQEAKDRYRPRKVRVERGGVGHYRVANGLRAGELIVVRGSFLLKTELKKGSIGAGCCAVEPTS